MNPVSPKCLVCRKEIEQDAKKCTECGAYQDWTRYVFRYTSVATAILGIIPIATIAVSLHEIAFGKKSSDLRAALVDCRSHQLDLVFTNIGEAPAIVSKVLFRSPDTSSQLDNFVIRRTGGNLSPTFLVDPDGSAIIVSYQPFIGATPTRFPQFPKGATSCKYRITVESLQFSSEPKRQELSCDCSRS